MYCLCVNVFVNLNCHYEFEKLCKIHLIWVDRRMPGFACSNLTSLNFPLKIKCSHCVYLQMSDMVGSVLAQNWVDRLICFSVIRNMVLELVQTFLRLLWLEFWDYIAQIDQFRQCNPQTVYTESLTARIIGYHVIIIIYIYNFLQ